jgi:hypothetical protein
MLDEGDQHVDLGRRGGFLAGDKDVQRRRGADLAGVVGPHLAAVGVLGRLLELADEREVGFELLLGDDRFLESVDDESTLISVRAFQHLVVVASRGITHARQLEVQHVLVLAHAL